MKSFWKKFGWTCMTLLPCIVSLIVQLGMGVVLLFITSYMATMQLGAGVASPADIDMAALSELQMELYQQHTTQLIFIYHIIGIIGFGIWYYFGCGRPKMTNPVKSFRGKCLPATIVLSFGLCFFANAFVLVGQYIVPEVIESYTELMEAAGLGTDTLTIIASIIFAPIGEEILCRGLTYHYAKKVVADMKNRRVAFWIANSLQALMFGIMHGNIVQGLYAFFLGLGLGWLRERYNSLYPAILAHAIINFSSTYLVEYPLTLLPENIWSYLILMAVSILIIAGGYLLGKAPKADEVSEDALAAEA